MNTRAPMLPFRAAAAGWLLLACFAALFARAADPAVTFAPPPSWVSPLPFARLPKSQNLDAALESRLLLRDVQINVATQESFHHEARQILTSSGVQNGGHFAMDFDPSCQSLVLNWIKIWRGTNSFDRLNLDNIKIIQPERNLDDYLFTGQKTAWLPLDDVRVGDIVDFACTIRGTDPIGGGKLSDAIAVQEYEPVEHLVTRLVWPTNRHLYVKNHGASAYRPAILKKGDTVEYIWDYRKVPGLRREDPLPVWYDPLPWIQWSEFQKWSDVNQWALSVFTNTAPLSADLTRQIKEWHRLTSVEDRVRAVLRFLQDDVRYQGIETGAEAYTPADPSVVFARRFGDCKDKTMLCVTILRALGIQADPVLVATGHRQTVQDWQPTPAAFDHAIVRVTLSGQSYWLDPTATFERGTLAERSWPNYGRGLVIQPHTSDLAVIPPSTVQPKTTVTEFALVRRLGQPTDLKVVTVADGPAADALRRRFSTTERETIATDDLNGFAALYPGITRLAPLDYADDEEKNEITVTEYYQIDRIANPLPNSSGLSARFYSYNVDRAIHKPEVSYRSMPLGLNYPNHQIFRAEITVPAAVPVNQGNWSINNPAFHFQKIVTIAGGKIIVEHQFDALAETVPVDAMPDYLKQLDEAWNLLDYVIVSY